MSTLLPAQQQLIGDVFGGGVTQVAYRQLGGDSNDPDNTTTPFLSTFFDINNPYGDADDEGNNTGVASNPSTFGAYLRSTSFCPTSVWLSRATR